MGAVMDHGMFVLGQEVAEFERQFADLCGVEYAVGVNSGTDALVLALKALDIGEGDEVITVPNSFIASTSCIVMAGAPPVFVDVREDYNIDPGLIEEAITPRTRAILLVHLTGRPADMDSVMEIASRYGIHVIEDCAQAVGAKYNGRLVGSFGSVGCFSLHPLKTLSACGDGGVLTTNDPELYQELMFLRNHGLKSREDCVMWGYNSRLDTIQAAMLLVKLKYLDGWTKMRRKVAQFYQECLMEVEQMRVPKDAPSEWSVYHTFIIQAERRDELKTYLGEKGIGTVVSYPVPIHLQPSAAGLCHPAGSFPVTESQAGQILNLPIYGELDHGQLKSVVDSVRGFYRLAN